MHQCSCPIPQFAQHPDGQELLEALAQWTMTQLLLRTLDDPMKMTQRSTIPWSPPASRATCTASPFSNQYSNSSASLLDSISTAAAKRACALGTAAGAAAAPGNQSNTTPSRSQNGIGWRHRCPSILQHCRSSSWQCGSAPARPQSARE